MGTALASSFVATLPRQSTHCFATQHPDVVLHNDLEGSMRQAAGDRGIHAITVEIGNPISFQQPMIARGLAGLCRIMAQLQMIPQQPDGAVVIWCEKIACNACVACRRILLNRACELHKLVLDVCRDRRCRGGVSRGWEAC